MKDELISLRVKGTQYADALIGDGDIVVLKKTSEVEDGGLAAVFIKSEQQMVIKRVYRGDYGISLVACNPSVASMHLDFDDYEIHGKVLIVIRQYDRDEAQP